MTTPPPPALLPIHLTTKPASPGTTDTAPSTDLTLVIGQSTTHHPMQQAIYCQNITITLPAGNTPTDLHTPYAAHDITTSVPYPGPHLPGYGWSIRTITDTPGETQFTCRPCDSPARFDGTCPVTFILSSITPNTQPGTATITITETTTLTPTSPYSTRQHHIHIDKPTLHTHA
ncbi:hypothetical protein QZH56_00355 [Streptomyces olivoreticuli]|uniref:hypothetical protein n=1 Tax=Streptomyces olivoreticuli TaxID=68246 RepID=UPI00265812BB|nr:hypothetical protein [Streptomyces olivoreticuli]WKK24185.1 hypothetical protein QZH56_00355 [Streptomyces olivoreticuli]